MGPKSRGPLKMSREMAHNVIVPPKKNYIPQFLKQRDINSYSMLSMRLVLVHAGESNSRPPDKELGALTKWLASRMLV